jgi:hypothetical protein
MKSSKSSPTNSLSLSIFRAALSNLLLSCEIGLRLSSPIQTIQKVDMMLPQKTFHSCEFDCKQRAV